MARRAFLAAAACLLSTAVSAQTFSNARSPGVTIERAPHAPTPQPESRRDRRDEHQRGGSSGPRPGDDLFRAKPWTYAPRYDDRSKDHRSLPLPYRYVVDPYPAGTSAIDRYPEPVVRPDRSGYLRLRVEPRWAQVYVDGYFVGTVQELSASGYPLQPGGYRIEIRAEGFETVTFEVRIRPYETVTYAKDLPRAVSVEPSSPTVPSVGAAPSKPLYVIPRCYAGDRRPVAADLPAGCTTAALRILPTR